MDKQAINALDGAEQSVGTVSTSRMGVTFLAQVIVHSVAAVCTHVFGFFRACQYLRDGEKYANALFGHAGRDDCRCDDAAPAGESESATAARNAERAAPAASASTSASGCRLHWFRGGCGDEGG